MLRAHIDDRLDTHHILDEYRDVAFSWKCDRPTGHSPTYVRRVMQREHCTSLIWFSRTGIGYDEVLFTWVVAGELRHVYQSGSTRGVAQGFVELKAGDGARRAVTPVVQRPTTLNAGALSEWLDQTRQLARVLRRNVV